MTLAEFHMRMQNMLSGAAPITETTKLPEFKAVPVKHNHAAHLAFRNPDTGHPVAVRSCPDCQREFADIPRSGIISRIRPNCPACLGENIA